MFVVHCVDKPGHLDVRKANRDAHLAYLNALGDALLLAGPTLSEDRETMTGSVLVLDIADRAGIEAFLTDEPYAKAGLFQSVTVLPYRKVLGK